MFLVFLLIGLSVREFRCETDTEEGGSGPDENEDESDVPHDLNTSPGVKSQKKEEPTLENRNMNSQSMDEPQEDDDNNDPSENVDDNDDNESNQDAGDDSNNNDENNEIDEGIDGINDKEADEIKDPVLINEPLPTTRPGTFQSSRSRLLSIISKPGILAGIVGGVIIGILTAALLILFIIYRMRKKDEGSYALEETKKPLNAYDYRHCPTKEFYA